MSVWTKCNDEYCGKERTIRDTPLRKQTKSIFGILITLNFALARPVTDKETFTFL